MAQAEPLLAPSIRAALPRLANQRRQVLVARAAAQRRAQIHAPSGIQTQEPRAIRGDAAAVAGAAKRRGDRRNDSELRAVRQAEPLGGGPALPPDRGDRA